MTAWYIGIIVWLQLDGAPAYAVTFGASRSIEECYKDMIVQSAAPENAETVKELAARQLTPTYMCVQVPRPVKS